MERIVITANKKKWPELQLYRIWQYRAVLLAFVKRDIRVQYAQTRLGLVWSALQAFTAALVINFFFGILLKVDTGDTPYLLFAFPGMIAWYYFSYIISYSGTSLLQAQHIIKKVYFPKLILPMQKMLTGLFEFVIWMFVYGALMIYYQFIPSVNIFLLPAAILANIICGLSIAVWLSAITVRYRDALLILPFLIGFGIFVTPVFFSTTMIPAGYQFLIYFNPMAGVIALYRWCILGTDIPYQYLAGFIPTLILLYCGLLYFRRVESMMADLI